ncbi:MAG: hypothetical protein ACR5KV_05315 [Wolbachia sp.]
MSKEEANTLVKGKVSDLGLAKYLLIHSNLNEQTEALDTVKQEINKEKLIEFLLEYAQLKGNVSAAKIIVKR